MDRMTKTQRISALVKEGIERFGSIDKMVVATGIGKNTLISWRDERTQDFRDDNLARLARGMRVSMTYLQTGRDVPSDTVLPTEAFYPSLEAFLKGRSDVTLDEANTLDSVRFSSGDPSSPDVWASLLLSIRGAQRSAPVAVQDLDRPRGKRGPVRP